MGTNNIAHRRTIGSVAACAIAAALALAAASYASAADYSGNWGNSSYSSFAYASNVSYTDAREKLNYTSSWDECYGDAPHKVEVAATGWDWNVQFVGSPIYWFGPGTSSYLDNYVKENGYPRALLWFNNYNSYNTTIYGEWSPDSI